MSRACRTSDKTTRYAYVLLAILTLLRYIYATWLLSLFLATTREKCRPMVSARSRARKRTRERPRDEGGRGGGRADNTARYKDRMWARSCIVGALIGFVTQCRATPTRVTRISIHGRPRVAGERVYYYSVNRSSNSTRRAAEFDRA